MELARHSLLEAARRGDIAAADKQPALEALAGAA
jgi:hypothetical protein